jgi:hypothetical protein
MQLHQVSAVARQCAGRSATGATFLQPDNGGGVAQMGAAGPVFIALTCCPAQDFAHFTPSRGIVDAARFCEREGL